MDIRIDDLRGAQIIRLLEEHLRGMYELSPPESVHALDLSGLRRPEITMWSAWEGSELLGCGALKELGAQHGEVKSMRTARAQLLSHTGMDSVLRAGAAAMRRGASLVAPGARPTLRYAIEGSATLNGGYRLPFSRSGEIGEGAR